MARKKKPVCEERKVSALSDDEILRLAEQYSNVPSSKMGQQFREHEVLMELLSVCGRATKNQVLDKLRGNVSAWMARPKDKATDVWLPRHIQICATAIYLFQYDHEGVVTNGKSSGKEGDEVPKSGAGDDPGTG